MSDSAAHQNLPPAIRTLRVKETIQNIYQKLTQSDNRDSYIGVVSYLTWILL